MVDGQRYCVGCQPQRSRPRPGRFAESSQHPRPPAPPGRWQGGCGSAGQSGCRASATATASHAASTASPMPRPPGRGGSTGSSTSGRGTGGVAPRDADNLRSSSTTSSRCRPPASHARTRARPALSRGTEGHLADERSCAEWPGEQRPPGRLLWSENGGVPGRFCGPRHLSSMTDRSLITDSRAVGPAAPPAPTRSSSGVDPSAVRSGERVARAPAEVFSQRRRRFLTHVATGARPEAPPASPSQAPGLPAGRRWGTRCGSARPE